MKQLFQSLGVKTNQDSKGFHFYSTSKDLFTLWVACKNDSALREAAKNADKLHRYVDDSSSNFAGITPKELENHASGMGIDLKAFQEAKEKLKDFSSALQTNFAPIASSRKRRFSEHDGEYSYDRRNEIEPFQACVKEKSGVLNTLVLNVDFNFSAFHDAAKITKFGAFCFAIFSKLEEAGISCEVNLRQSINGLCTSGKVKDKKTDFYIRVKEAGSYVEESEIARCFTSGFYRRACFAFWTACAENNDSEVCSGLGFVQALPDETQAGSITLSFGNQTDNQEKLIAGILAAIKKG